MVCNQALRNNEYKGKAVDVANRLAEKIKRTFGQGWSVKQLKYKTIFVGVVNSLFFSKVKKSVG